MTGEKYTITDDSIKSALKSGEIGSHRIDIIDPEKISKLNVPDKQVVLDALSEDNQDLAPMIEMVYVFLQTPIVEDHFEADDEARDAWEEAVFEQFGNQGTDIILRNRLRVNVIGEVLSIIDIFPDFLQDYGLRNILNQIDKRAYDAQLYKNLSLEEKLKVVASVTDTGIKMLKYLAQK
ncbi:MAG: hypothetical protein GW941_02815 [Candidatus Pacebacteria bacterium]|nr:hypothetical protein [Candidatus Paceibacterota bacterium]